MNKTLSSLFRMINKNDGINDKARLAKLIAETFNLIKDRSVYYGTDFAIRFSSSATKNFSNTILSLSNLRKYDNRPFIVCLVTPSKNYCFIANSTFLKKISHSSQELRINNIRGSFNGSDIAKDFGGIANISENIDQLFAIHDQIGFEGNLVRLVEATNNISPSGKKYGVGENERRIILNSPRRATAFVTSSKAATLKNELDKKVRKYKNEILLAALIENVNVRGRVIEYLIAGEDEALRQNIIAALNSDDCGIPQFKTNNTLGDYHRIFDNFDTETDVKTKIMILNSNPKAYNLDKMLEFLTNTRSVFMFYFIGVETGKIISTALISIFQKDLLNATILLRHWAGRNSRGVSQFDGRVVNKLIQMPDAQIDVVQSIEFLESIINL